MLVTKNNVDSIDVVRLAESLRRECERVLTGKPYRDPVWQDRVRFAAALLAALDCFDFSAERCDQGYICAGYVRDSVIRAAARAWLTADGKLELEATPPAVPEKCGTCGGDKKWCHRGSCSFVEGGRLNTRGICEFSETCANRQPCPDCTSTPTAAPEKCELCGGTKVVIVNLSDTEEVPCPSCTPAPTVTYTRNCAKCGAVVPNCAEALADVLCPTCGRPS